MVAGTQERLRQVTTSECHLTFLCRLARPRTTLQRSWIWRGRQCSPRYLPSQEGRSSSSVMFFFTIAEKEVALCFSSSRSTDHSSSYLSHLYSMTKGHSGVGSCCSSGRAAISSAKRGEATDIFTVMYIYSSWKLYRWQGVTCFICSPSEGWTRKP